MENKYHCEKEVMTGYKQKPFAKEEEIHETSSQWDKLDS